MGRLDIYFDINIYVEKQNLRASDLFFQSVLLLMEPLQVQRQGFVRLDHAIGAKNRSVGSEPPKVLTATAGPNASR